MRERNPADVFDMTDEDLRGCVERSMQALAQAALPVLSRGQMAVWQQAFAQAAGRQLAALDGNDIRDEVDSEGWRWRFSGAAKAAAVAAATEAHRVLALYDVATGIAHNRIGAATPEIAVAMERWIPEEVALRTLQHYISQGLETATIHHLRHQQEAEAEDPEPCMCERCAARVPHA